MTDEQRAEIAAAARRHAAESARAQGLPEVITDPDVLRPIAALIAAASHKDS